MVVRAAAFWQLAICSALIGGLQFGAAASGSADLIDDWGTDVIDSTESVDPVLTEDPVLKKTTKELPRREPPNLWQPKTWKDYKIELGMIAIIVIYLVNIFVGRAANDKVAKAFAEAFCSPGKVFDRNFTLVGIGGDAQVPLIKESAADYKLYCSGRRHCTSMQALLKLRHRQDLFSLFISLVFPTEDKVDIEVYMKEGSMPQTVIAIATKKVMRGMLQEETGEDDIRKLTRKLDIKTPGWPSDKLVVYGEHSSIFQDLVTDQLLDQVFRRPAFDSIGKYIRYFHFTPEQSYGPKDQKAVLRFSFALPPKENMESLTRLISSVGLFIDLVGNFKLSPDLVKRAEKLRQELDSKDDKAKAREDLAEELRNSKRLEEAERMKKMTPEQREKYKAKKEKLEQVRRQRKFSKRM